MLTEDNIAFLEEMTTNLRNESGVDKLIILDKLRAHYFPDISFTSRDISLITHIPRDRLKFIEFNAIKKDSTSNTHPPSRRISIQSTGRLTYAVTF